MSSTVVKVAFVGSGGAGKTTLASRLVSGEFIQSMMTVGISIETWSITEEESGGEIKVALFDLGGQSQFRFFQASLLAGTHTAFIVVDMTRPRSLYEVDGWLSMIRHVPRERWLLIGNKCDEATLVSEAELKAKAEELGIPYVMVSAKTGENFDRLIAAATAAITA